MQLRFVRGPLGGRLCPAPEEEAAASVVRAAADAEVAQGYYKSAMIAEPAQARDAILEMRWVPTTGHAPPRGRT